MHSLRGIPVGDSTGEVYRWRRTCGGRGDLGEGILSDADVIYLEEIREAEFYDDIWQAFAVLLPLRAVGVMRGVNRVCYDVSSNPPATIEWE